MIYPRNHVFDETTIIDALGNENIYSIPSLQTSVFCGLPKYLSDRLVVIKAMQVSKINVSIDLPDKY